MRRRRRTAAGQQQDEAAQRQHKRRTRLDLEREAHLDRGHLDYEVSLLQRGERDFVCEGAGTLGNVFPAWLIGAAAAGPREMGTDLRSEWVGRVLGA